MPLGFILHKSILLVMHWEEGRLQCYANLFLPGSLRPLSSAEAEEGDSWLPGPRGREVVLF